MKKMSFKPSEPSDGQVTGHIKVIIADDEQEVHNVTRFLLKDFQFQGKKIEFLSAYSGEECKKLLLEHPDASLILLDIVMEKDNSGLEVANFIRHELNNHLIRIIMRTGQPGLLPEVDVVSQFEVDDYKEKTELTDQKFISAITLALRAYTNIFSINAFRMLLEQEVAVRTAELHKKNQELELLNQELALLNQELERLANHDKLTGIFNRMRFEHVLETEINRCHRYNSVSTLATLDIDYFKDINDRFGHAGGDSALCQFVKLVAGNIRECDVLARWGGEEFMILFTELSLDEAKQAADKLRHLVERHCFEIFNNMTVSFGLTLLLPEDSMDSVLKRVDEALYEAKRFGRNKVVCM